MDFDALVQVAVDRAWALGHLLLGFDHDSEDSIVSECIVCGAIAAVDFGFVGGTATTAPCTR